MIDSPWIAALVTLFGWWFSTGIILWRVRVADNGLAQDHVNSVIFGLPLLAVGVIAAAASLPDLSAKGIYLAFLAALALWGWIELAFLSGVITGPNRSPCPNHATTRQRFWRAVGTIAWHELALVVALAGLGLMSYQAVNPFAFGTFALLFVARIFAKLNLFLGVPRINTQFLPRPLSHLASHFRIGRITAFFPFSVSVLTVLSALLLERAINVTAPGMAVGYALLTCLCLLALLEHWFMVLQLPDEKLWRWMMPARKSLTKITTQNDPMLEDANGL
ncbi:MAG: putative photosynthetic complex assembly protein PuhE [Cypionkella sp.]|nr:putative photosynthetic complex assembly protein PuhE [Cypionkella sp.]